MPTLWTLTLALLACVSFTATLGCGKGDDRIDMTRYVAVDPGPSVVRLATAAPKILRVTVRNVSERELKGLRLTVKSKGCAAAVSPARVAALAPGDRTAFSATLERRPKVAAQRYPLEITLRADGLPLPAGIDLVLDLRSGSDGGWIDVGQVKLIRRPTGGRTVLFLLAGLPILLLVGWMLWRTSHRRKGGSEAATDDDPSTKKA